MHEDTTKAARSISIRGTILTATLDEPEELALLLGFDFYREVLCVLEKVNLAREDGQVGRLFHTRW